MADSKTAELSAIGVSIWLDDLSRDRIVSGGLQQLIDQRNVVGVTTNPTIFATALAKGNGYDSKVAELAAAGTPVTSAVFEIITSDVAAACDIFAPVYERTGHVDGRVSIEVEPGLAHDAAGTIAQAKRLFHLANDECLEIFQQLLQEGFVMLCSDNRYRLRSRTAARYVP